MSPAVISQSPPLPEKVVPVHPTAPLSKLSVKTVAAEPVVQVTPCGPVGKVLIKIGFVEGLISVGAHTANTVFHIEY